MVAFGTVAGRKIVNSYPGPGTGETIYVDERGGRWITEPYGANYDETCPPLRATVRGNLIDPEQK